MNEILLKDIDALLITNPTNIRYLTGFMGLAPDEREAYLLIVPNQFFLFTSAIYMEKAHKIIQLSNFKSSNYQIKIVEISREKPLTKKISELLNAPKQGSTLRPIKMGFEENNLTFREYKQLQSELNGIELSPTQHRVELLRQIKRPDEIKNIKKAAKITDECFSYILKKLKPGVTESEIAWDIETFFRKNNATSAFSPIVAFNQNSSQPHYSPGAQGLIPHEGSTLILLDFGARVNGYCADMTRVVFMGKPNAKQKLVYEIVLKAQQTAIDVCNNYFSSEIKNKVIPAKAGIHTNGSPGLRPRMTEEISGAKLDQAARNVIKKSGFPTYPHSLGHNLGLDIHEGPRLSAKREEFLTPEMVFTIEPGIYLPGEFGIRIEDLVYLKADGIEILSKSKKELIAL